MACPLSSLLKYYCKKSSLVGAEPCLILQGGKEKSAAAASSGKTAGPSVVKTFRTAVKGTTKVSLYKLV